MPQSNLTNAMPEASEMNITFHIYDSEINITVVFKALYTHQWYIKL